MEPFRIVVDETALRIPENDRFFKRKMANVLNYSVTMEGKKTTLDLAIRRHVHSVLCVLETEDVAQISYPETIDIEDEL